jgi:F0F1-type ATP synthase membrane subunit b/b'
MDSIKQARKAVLEARALLEKVKNNLKECEDIVRQAEAFNEKLKREGAI